MYFCYVDESGCTGQLPSATPPPQIAPVFAVVANIIPENALKDITIALIRLKSQFFRQEMTKAQHFLDRILVEVKGKDVRRQLRSPDRQIRRRAIAFLSRVVSLLEKHEARIVGRVYIKGIQSPMKSRQVYTSAIQSICSYTNNFLQEEQDSGIIIADSRTASQNARVAHSILTQKYKRSGDTYCCIPEMPTFGHSQNHAGLQIADLIVSGIVALMACHAYCSGHVRSPHVNANYAVLKGEFGKRLEELQYRYSDSTGRMRGGLTVCDGHEQRSGGLLFH